MASSSAASVSQCSPIAPTEPSAGSTARVDEIIDVDKLEDEPKGKRQKNLTSAIWTGSDYTLHDVVEEVDGKKIKVQYAKCNHCSKYDKPRDSKNGTSVFRNHLKTHNVVPRQQVLKLDKNVGSDTAAAPTVFRYDQEASLRKFHLAIIMHDYPFSIAEHEYFVDFIKSLRPTFPMKSRVTTRKAIMAIFLEQKEQLYEHFKSVNRRFSATMDMWTSNQNKGYMCITVHWIDESWNIQKRIVSFMHLEGRHTGANMSDAFCASITRWFIDKKMFSLTLDNAAANEVVVNDVIAEVKKKSPLVCDDLFFHVRCACHILNLVARDGLKHIASAVLNIRSFVLLVKCSPPQWEDFIKCAAECGLDTKKGLTLDVLTRWNSTYLMLRNAIYYRKAFDRLYGLDKKRYKDIAPSDSDWEMAETLCKCLKKFNDITELLSGTLYPTANLFYQSFCEVKALIVEWCRSGDDIIFSMANSMDKKFEKYWNKSNVALAVAFFLDPRFKKKAVEYLMKRSYGPLFYRAKVDAFIVVVKKMYESYAAASRSATKPQSSVSVEASKDDLMEEGDDDDGLRKFLYDSDEAADAGNTSDLDKYMSIQPLNLTKSNSGPDKFDILSWWKIHQQEYPILSVLARDVLAMQASTVASESAFSAGGRVIDPFRSRLDPEIVEALICRKDWIAASRRDSNRGVASILNDLDVAEILVDTLCEGDLDEREKQKSSDDESSDSE